MVNQNDLSKIEEEVKDGLEEIILLRRELHRKPELGWEEKETADRIAQILEREKIPYARHKTALTALIEGKKPGGCVAFRADMDALPIQETSDLPYSSEREGIMHACGHDAHTAILLGAGLWFARNRNRFSGAVKLLFQPAEETDGGAEPMIGWGALENPRVDRIFGLHVMPYLPPGHVEMKKGVLNGSSTRFTLTVRGKSGHGAYPESGVDAIMIAGHIITAVQSLVSRRVSPLDSAVVSIGTVRGGKAANIIADEVKMEGTMRTVSNRRRDELVKELETIALGTASALGGKAELDYRHGYAALVNADDEVDLASRVARTYLGEAWVHWKEKPSMGAEDFSFFLMEKPGCFYHLGCGPADVLAGGEFAPLHSGRFLLNEDCLLKGIVMQIGIGLDALEELESAGANRIISVPREIGERYGL